MAIFRLLRDEVFYIEYNYIAIILCAIEISYCVHYIGAV
jgi:hypothetical protein